MPSQPVRIDGKQGDGSVSRYCLLFRGEEYPLHLGQYFIGRHTSCDLTVEDPLVSRRHARLVVSEQTVLVQDLDSENGVFVNERRIESPVRLDDGDRILVGTHEISFFLKTPESDGLPESGPEGAVAAVPRSLPPQLQQQSGNSTLQADAFVYLGRVADRMLATSRPEAAQRIMEGHLRDVMQAARGGTRIDPDLLDTAAQYALKLARATRDGRWIDYAVELHLAYGKLMQPMLAQSLRLLFHRVPNTSAQLMRDYQEALLRLRPQLSLAEQRLVDQIAGIETDSR